LEAALLSYRKDILLSIFFVEGLNN